MPNSKEQRERLLGKKSLNVSDLGKLLDDRDLCCKVYAEAKDKWGKYFQSPIDKVALAQEGNFKFDSYGAFRGVDRNGKNSKETQADLNKLFHDFFPLSEFQDEELKSWLSQGEPLSAEKVETVKKILFPARSKLTNELLFDQPICRLVHRSQLRRDLDYQVVYQLTPAQLRLIDPRDEYANAALEDLRRNQRMYWGISETFQSLVAMFDSDLGSSRKANKRAMTKELIRLSTSTRERREVEILAPDELNKLSPLRFWAPPPVFADSVFHMLLWRSVITGTDLFGRRVITKDDALPGEKDIPVNRASRYYVLINWFNAAKFRLADYEKLFDSLMQIARLVGKASLSRNTALNTLPDIQLSEDPKGLLYPSYFPHSKIKFHRYRKVRLSIPCDSLKKHNWELAWDSGKNDSTTISDLLKFLRDKALEIVIWSKYQMEIRSVGPIPVQHLYQVELNQGAIELLNDLAKKWRTIETKRLTAAQARVAKAEINEVMKTKIFNQEVDHWVSLKRVYGGTNRKIDDKDSWDAVPTLKSPRLAVHSRSRRATVTDEKRKNAKNKP